MRRAPGALTRGAAARSAAPARACTRKRSRWTARGLSSIVQFRSTFGRVEHRDGLRDRLPATGSPHRDRVRSEHPIRAYEVRLSESGNLRDRASRRIAGAPRRSPHDPWQRATVRSCRRCRSMSAVTAALIAVVCTIAGARRTMTSNVQLRGCCRTDDCACPGAGVTSRSSAVFPRAKSTDGEADQKLSGSLGSRCRIEGV